MNHMIHPTAPEIPSIDEASPAPTLKTPVISLYDAPDWKRIEAVLGRPGGAPRKEVRRG